mmetsp:Transcript_29908/g.43699  ORF Transcript_29908/g.43699 Transcript_29908/m.43699 type:complete len:213 (+) Transcript_29908:11-649(+)
MVSQMIMMIVTRRYRREEKTEEEVEEVNRKMKKRTAFFRRRKRRKKTMRDQKKNENKRVHKKKKRREESILMMFLLSFIQLLIMTGWKNISMVSMQLNFIILGCLEEKEEGTVIVVRRVLIKKKMYHRRHYQYLKQRSAMRKHAGHLYSDAGKEQSMLLHVMLRVIHLLWQIRPIMTISTFFRHKVNVMWIAHLMIMMVHAMQLKRRECQIN